MSIEKPDVQERGSALSMILAFMGAGGFIAFLILISNGLLLYMMLGVLCFCGVGMLHYLLWGHLLTQQTSRQTEEMRLDEEARKEP